MKAIAYALQHLPKETREAIFRRLPGELRWKLMTELFPRETRLIQMLYIINHEEERWPRFMTQISYFAPGGDVIAVEGDIDPWDYSGKAPPGTEFATLYMDWDVDQRIVLLERNGRFSRALISGETSTIEAHITDADDFRDSLGGFAEVFDGPAQG